MKGNEFLEMKEKFVFFWKCEYKLFEVEISISIEFEAIE